MPNWKIPTDVRGRIINEAISFGDRPAHYALMNFPMTVAEIQLHASALTQEQIFPMRTMIDQGVRTIERHFNTRIAFFRRSFPGLRRSVVVNVRLPEWIVLGRPTYMGMQATSYKDDEPHYIPCDTVGLSDEDKIQIAEYLNTAVRHARLSEIVTNVVPILMDREITPTTSHLHALWPLLATLHPDNTWRERFRNPTRTLKAYQPDPVIISYYRKYMEACETAILAGQMLEAIRGDRKKIIVGIETWERLPGDIIFPLVDAPEIPKKGS